MGKGGWILRTKILDNFSGNAKYYITHPKVFIEDFVLTIKTIWERALYGWDRTAVWSLDWWICDIMPEILEDLKMNKTGVPGYMFDILRNGDIDTSEKGWEKARKKYDGYLDEMIEGFRAGKRIIEIGGDVPYDEWKFQEKDDWKKFHRAMILFHEHFFSLWT